MKNKILGSLAILTLTIPLSTEALSKSETVYSKLNSDGSLKNIYVNEHLINNDKLSTIDDYSDLKGIINLNGSETFSVNNTNLTWNALGNDIYYQGKYESELPIKMNITYNGKEYVFIDTAGLRRKNKIKEELERYMIVRTVSAVERAEVVVLMIDAEEGVTEQDAKIAGIAHERGKATIIVVNKWDAIEKDDKTIYKFTEKVRNTLSFMPYAELLFVSAKTGQRLPKLFETIDIVSENHAMRVATGVLNEIMAEAVAMQQPPSDKGKRLRLYYITQVAVKPPTFVIFVNDKELMHFSYTRYIENQIRETFGFKGTPLRFIIRERKEKDQ